MRVVPLRVDPTLSRVVTEPGRERLERTLGDNRKKLTGPHDGRGSLLLVVEFLQLVLQEPSSVRGADEERSGRLYFDLVVDGRRVARQTRETLPAELWLDQDPLAELRSNSTLDRIDSRGMSFTVISQSEQRPSAQSWADRRCRR